MSEITSLVTAEAVKEVLRSEEVRSALKQKLRHNLEKRVLMQKWMPFWMNCWAHRQLSGAGRPSRVRGGECFRQRW